MWVRRFWVVDGFFIDENFSRIILYSLKIIWYIINRNMEMSYKNYNVDIMIWYSYRSIIRKYEFSNTNRNKKLNTILFLKIFYKITCVSIRLR